MPSFLCADILLPKNSLEQWAVIACDQFVSQPEYWQAVRQKVGNAPSALNLILPESELNGNCDNAIAAINTTMYRYLHGDIFQCYPNSFIYVERTLQDGSVRQGVVGCVDLEQYNFSPASASVVRATEQTVAERVPPRMDIRRDAPLELPHVLLLCDDEKKLLLASLAQKKNILPLLYDFHLMEGGGRIQGWLVQGENEAAFSEQLTAYEQRIREKHGSDAVLYAVGDGNHSLAAAKGCYEEQKAANCVFSPARYALVELENIHDDALVFEPIHRIVKGTDPLLLLDAMKAAIGCETGAPVHWHIGNEQGAFYIQPAGGTLPVGIVQDFLDSYLDTHPGNVDYIHGEDAVCQLSQVPGTLGLLLPSIDKSTFFQGIIADGTLPRKTFSMGHAQEKRYYLEARKIR